MMIRRLLPIGLFAAVLGASEITKYQVRLDAAENGTAQATATLLVSKAAAGTLNIPVGFSALEEPRLGAAPQGCRLERGPSNGQTLLHLQLPEGVPSEFTLTLAFRVPKAYVAIEPGPGEKSPFPEGSRLFRHAFVNTQEAAIGSYRLELLLPTGFRAQSIREQLPKLGKSESAPRVRLDRIDGRQSATLQCANLKQGDDTSMAIELVPARRSLGWLVAGLILSALYLVFFRDLIQKPRP